MVSYIGSGLGELHWLLCNSHVVLVPLAGECVTIVDETLSSVDGYFLSTDKVSGGIELLFLEGHSWAVSKNGSLGELHLLQKHGEWVLTRVLLIDFLDLNLAVRKIVSDNEVLITAIK